MPVTLFTGTPGAGKTLSALERLCQEIKVDPNLPPKELHLAIAAAQGLDEPMVVCVGVEGIREDLFTVEEDPYNWQQYPDGTLFLIDEAWKWFGSHNLEVKKDPRVLALAEHRHRGMRFLLTAQYPAQLIPHVRALVDEHVHVRRKFGTEVTSRYSWPHLVESPNQLGCMKDAQEAVWKYPHSLYSLYQSATVHNIKRRIPWKVLALPLVVLAVLVCGVLAVRAVAGIGAESEVLGQSAVGRAEGARPAAPPPRPDPLATSYTPDSTPSVAWLSKWVPRVRGIPASAPAYDDFEPVRVPRLYCVSMESQNGPQRCICHTEQATRVPISVELCSALAFEGIYDPYDELPAPEPPQGYAVGPQG